jgi:hypothetical protein
MTTMQETKGYAFGQKLGFFLIGLSKLIFLCFLPFITLVLMIVILGRLTGELDLNTALVLSTLIASIAYYYKR